MPPATRHCQDGTRRGSHEHVSFACLGFTFRARGMRTRHGQVFTGFGPAISKDALKKISAEVRSWRLHQHTGYTIGDLARWINPIVRGWMQYYGAFYRSALYPLLKRINGYLVRWLRKKYKRLRTFKKAHEAWGRLISQYPRCFAQFAWVTAHWREG
jgi:RNA-directed DNA polymerase